ncbi:MAG: NAD-dependent epimerase/dehydratase family protein [Chloroflexi bacterium]|nr:NAD-dependent epimerase/dehydratase family protein [Chloroflexota bacterium]
MNILIIGANGYTGARLVKALIERGHRVRGLVRQVERGIALEKLGMELREGDVRNFASLYGIARDSEIIFNLAGTCRVEPSESRAILWEGARNLFRVADRAALKKYIWVSNVAVYGFPEATARLTETSPLQPKYALGKITLEAEKLARENVPAIAVRVANIYGPGRDGIAALKEGRLRLLNDGNNWTSRIHVDDLVATLVAAMENARADSIYLAADDLPMLQREFYQELAAAIGASVPLSLEMNAARAFGLFGRAMNALAGERRYPLSENIIGLLSGNYYCVNEKIKNDLGVKLEYPTWREGYRAILADDTQT